MASLFSLGTVDYKDYATELIGISKDSCIMEGNPTWNFGGSNFVGNGMTVGRDTHGVFEFQMPNEEDIVGFDDIQRVELRLTLASRTFTGSATNIIIGLMEIPDNFQEGTLNGTAGVCNWTQNIPGVPWAKGDGAVASRVNSYETADGLVIWSLGFTGASSVDVEYAFDVTELVRMGERYRIVLIGLETDGTTGGGGDTAIASFYSTEYPTASKRPYLRVVYRDYPPEAFDSSDDALSIEPNPANPEQPLLKWGGVNSVDFTAFKLYRSTSPITSVTALTPIATITDNADQEYIDTFSHVDGTTYYYVVVAEDGLNTGDNATLSKNVSFTKPSITTGVISPSGASNVGTSKTVTATSPQQIKRLYVDWKDNIDSWYDFEFTATSKAASHIYVVPLTTFNPQMRIEDELGFWSGLFTSTTSASINDTTPNAKLVVSAKKAIVGDTIRLNATFSQPAGADVTIINYKFKRDASDSWQDNGSDPIYEFDSGTYPGTAGVKTASVLITTSSSLNDTDSATYELETGTPTDITPGNVGGLSTYTRIHELDHTFAINKQVEVPIGSDKTAKQFRISTPPQHFTVHATSEWPKMEDDMNIIRDAWENDTYLRLQVPSEAETKIIQYDFMLDGDISVGHRFKNKQNWSFPVRVINRTEIAKPKIIGDITLFSNPGGGKVQATSNGHGLKNGMYVLIRGTINYNGTYLVQNATTNTFRFTATWVANDAIGTWAKVGES